LPLIFIIIMTGCASGGLRPLTPATEAVECSSHASAMMYQNQIDGLPKYVELGTSGSFTRDDMPMIGRLQSISFTSKSVVDQCRPIRSSGAYDNPDVDAFRKKNRLVVVMTGEADVAKKEFRWQGGLILNIVSLSGFIAPAIGIEELDPDGSMTRRILYLDGRKRPLVFHVGEFRKPPVQQVPAPPGTNGRVSVI
jgi:hypothetical protein